MKTLLRLLLVVTVLYWLALLVVTHLPPRQPPTSQIDDKVAHFVGYFLLCAFLLVLRSLFRRNAPQHDWLIVAIVLAYGMVDELTQPIFGRICDHRDWLADAAGAATALVCVGLVRWLVLRRAERSAAAEGGASVADAPEPGPTEITP